MKSLQQYISEQMVCELSSKLLSDASLKAKSQRRRETAKNLANGAGKALERELNHEDYKENNKETNKDKSYRVGDIYQEDGKNVGIVVDTKNGGKHATVMSLLSFDKDGNPTTKEKKIEYVIDAVKGASKYRNGKWHLPSIEELKTMYKNFDKIQSVLKSTKNALALGGKHLYWSSTEYSSGNALFLDMDNGIVYRDYGEGYNHYVRAFLSI